MADLDIVVGSQENIQPLRRGRNLSALVAGMKETKENKQEMIRSFEKELVASSGIEPWLRYIKWAQEAFPSGGPEGKLRSILERCAQHFQGDERYKNDIRYIRVWVEYIYNCNDKDELFKFMEQKGIGLEQALYYEAYALYLENSSLYSAADKIYELGVRRKADPLQRLQRHQQEFAHRMLTYIERVQQESELGGGGGEGGERAGGGETDENGRAVPRKPLTLRSLETEGVGFGQSSKAGVTGNGATTFAVFSDADGADTGAAQPHYELGAERDRTKENRHKPSTWAGGLGVGGGEGVGGSSFAVFSDDATAAPVAASTAKSKPAKGTATSSRHAPKNEEGRRPGEVPGYDTAALISGESDGPELQFEEVRAARYPYIPPAEVEEDGEEDMDVSMEEEEDEDDEIVVRLPNSASSTSATTTTATAATSHVPVPNTKPIVRSDMLTPTAPTPSHHDLRLAAARLSFGSDSGEDTGTSFTAAATRKPVATAKVAQRPPLASSTAGRASDYDDAPEPTIFRAPSPTINTRAAIGDVLDMFSGDLNFEEATMTAMGLGGLTFMRALSGGGGGGESESGSGGGFEVFCDPK